MKKPTFLIIGAQKAGTTSFYEHLNIQDEIFMSPEKEPRFFAFEKDSKKYTGPDDPAAVVKYKTWDAYLTLFDKVKNEVAIGEASTIYLYNKLAPERIKHYLPNAKLIAILRDPVLRAYSNYTYNLRDGREDLSFEKALEEEENRISLGWGPLWHYKAKGFYVNQLKRYYDLFPKENIKIIFFEDLVQNVKSTVEDSLVFLGANNSMAIQPIVSNKSGMPKIRIVNNLLNRNFLFKKQLKKMIPTSLLNKLRNWLNSWNLKRFNPLEQKTKTLLYRKFSKEYDSLENLIGQKLPDSWRHE